MNFPTYSCSLQGRGTARLQSGSTGEDLQEEYEHVSGHQLGGGFLYIFCLYPTGGDDSMNIFQMGW